MLDIVGALFALGMAVAWVLIGGGRIAGAKSDASDTDVAIVD